MKTTVLSNKGAFSVRASKMIAVFGIRIYVVMTIRILKFSRKKLKTALGIWISNLVSIICWKFANRRQPILVRHRIGSDRVLPIALNLLIGVWYLMFFIVSTTRKVVSDFWPVIFDQKSKKHYSVRHQWMIFFGMMCTRVGIFMAPYMCVIDFAIVCDHWGTSTSFQWTPVWF